MRRLQAIAADVTADDFDSSFVAPQNVDTWVRYLGQIRPSLNPLRLMHARVRRNLGYRIQMMEFEGALLLLNRETRERFAGRSTLHETISCMKIHQFAVLAHSVLEGLGAHFWRVRREADGHAVNEAAPVRTNFWRPELADEILRLPNAPAKNRQELIDQLTAITSIRDRIHLDTVEIDYPLHINELTYADSFVPTYNTFKEIMSVLNAHWPRCCLNEGI